MEEFNPYKTDREVVLDMRGDFQFTHVDKNWLDAVANDMNLGVVSVQSTATPGTMTSMFDIVVAFESRLSRGRLSSSIVFLLFRYCAGVIASAYDEVERVKVVGPVVAQAMIALMDFFGKGQQDFDLSLVIRNDGVNNNQLNIARLFGHLWLTARILQNAELVGCLIAKVQALNNLGTPALLALCAIVFSADTRYPALQMPEQPMRQYLEQMLRQRWVNKESLGEAEQTMLWANRNLVARVFRG